jgi:hypothetical protein
MKFIIYVLLALLANAAHADGVVKEIARGYCKVTHPVEWIAPVRHENTCEEQHVLQQQHGGNDKANISIIPASSHIATDTWGGMEFGFNPEFGKTGQKTTVGALVMTQKIHFLRLINLVDTSLNMRLFFTIINLEIGKQRSQSGMG